MNELGQLLLVKRLGKSHEGTWGLPGGTMKPGETAVEALRREMREELDIEITVKGFTGHFYDAYNRDPRYATAIDLPFICSIKNGTPRPVEESSEVRWFRPEELNEECFPYDQRQMVIDAGIINV